MRVKNPVVRVTVDRATADKWGLLIEQLRYMGHFRVHRDGDNGVVFDIYPIIHASKGEPREAWCRQNAERMRSFGINAVVAPEWNDMTYLEKNQVEGKV